MKRNLIFAISIGFIILTSNCFSQPMENGKKQSNPEETNKGEEKANNLGKMRTSIAAYRGLAELYREQGKIDDAIVQMNKILDLANFLPEEERSNNEEIGGVYLEISEMYVQTDRLADAEKTINKGIIMGKNPEISGKLYLNLARIYQKTGKAAEAEGAFKKVLELNGEGTK